MVNNLKNIKPEIAFLIIGLVFGVAFLLVTPPFQMGDESMHFYRAADVSEGHIMPEKLGDKSDVIITSSIESIAWKFPRDLSNYPNNKLKITYITPLLSEPLNNEIKSSVDISTIAIVTYPPVPYLASALGMDLGKLFNLSPLFLLYIGRLMNLIVWLLLIYMAIKVTPVHKWVFVLLSLMPMTIFQGASISADSFTIAISFLVIALFLKFALDNAKKMVTKLDIFILFALILMLTLSKPFYFLLIFLFFLIPSYKFGNRKKMFLTFSIIFLSILVIESFWYIATHSLYVPANAQASIHNQVAFILANPVLFPHILLSTLWSNTLTYLSEFVGVLGWWIFLPQWLVCSYIVVLILVALLDKNEIKINLKQRIISFITLFTISVMIFVVEYVAWTSVGQNVIDGVQGRYFIPLAPLFFLLFYNNNDYSIEKGLNVGLIIFILISLSVAIFEIIQKFYVL